MIIDYRDVMDKLNQLSPTYEVMAIYEKLYKWKMNDPRDPENKGWK